jgi:predicted SAM-dependent methyltransferase
LKPTLKQRLGQYLIPVLPISRRSFDILRFELTCLVQRLRNSISPIYYQRLRELRTRNQLSVNLGSSGYGLPGWVNIDAFPRQANIFIAYDIRRPLPFRTGQVKRLLAEHVVEHLDFREEVPRLFGEIYRVLEIGGVARIIVPDTARFMSAYVHRSADEFAALGWDLQKMPPDIYTTMHIVNHVFHQGGEHQFGWDFETMDFALRRAGFKSIERRQFRDSADPALAIDREEHKFYSLIVEAIK